MAARKRWQTDGGSSRQPKSVACTYMKREIANGKHRRLRVHFAIPNASYTYLIYKGRKYRVALLLRNIRFICWGYVRSFLFVFYVRGKGLLAGIPFLTKSYTCSVRNKFRPEIYNIKQLKSWRFKLKIIKECIEK